MYVHVYWGCAVTYLLREAIVRLWAVNSIVFPQQSDELGVSGTPLFPSTVSVKAGEVGSDIKGDTIAQEDVGKLEEAVIQKEVAITGERAGPSSGATGQEVQEWANTVCMYIMYICFRSQSTTPSQQKIMLSVIKAPAFLNLIMSATKCYWHRGANIHFYCPLLGGCYVFSSKVNTLHSEKVIISGVKVFISGDYIKSLYWREQEHNRVL